MSKYCPVMDSVITYLPCIECDDMWCRAFFCLVVGSRTFDDYDLLCQKLDYLLQNKEKIVIVSGGARGADSLAEKYAFERNYPCKIFNAGWAKDGKKAGFLRNRRMHEYIARQRNRGVVAFWDGVSTGTADNFRLAKEFRNPIRVIRF